MQKGLRHYAEEYLKALKKNDPSKMARYMHPVILESIGGRKKFIEVMSQFRKRATNNDDIFQMLKSTKIEKIGKAEVRGNRTISVLDISIPVIWNGRIIARLVAPTLAVTMDNRANWYFVEGNIQGRSILTQHDRIPRSALPEFQIGLKVGKEKPKSFRSEKALKRELLNAFKPYLKDPLSDGALFKKVFAQISRLFS